MTDRRTDGRTDGRTDRRTDRRMGKNNMSPDPVGGRHNYNKLHILHEYLFANSRLANNSEIENSGNKSHVKIS